MRILGVFHPSGDPASRSYEDNSERRGVLVRVRSVVIVAGVVVALVVSCGPSPARRRSLRAASGRGSASWARSRATPRSSARSSSALRATRWGGSAVARSGSSRPIRGSIRPRLERRRAAARPSGRPRGRRPRRQPRGARRRARLQAQGPASVRLRIRAPPRAHERLDPELLPRRAERPHAGADDRGLPRAEAAGAYRRRRGRPLAYSRQLASVVETRLRARGVDVTRVGLAADDGLRSLVSRIDGVDVVFLPWQVAATAQEFGEQLRAAGKQSVLFGSDALDSATSQDPGLVRRVLRPRHPRDRGEHRVHRGLRRAVRLELRPRDLRGGAGCDRGVRKRAPTAAPRAQRWSATSRRRHCGGRCSAATQVHGRGEATGAGFSIFRLGAGGRKTMVG